jgi:glycosyltransferase involved in cell wall biosynthesis
MTERFEGGCSLGNKIKRSKIGEPLITIITATHNAADHLLRTIKFIRDLTYDNIEWIIVDGASRDNTVELIRQNEDVIDYWISEPDAGIYDAWNKGVKLARGDWIAFLGAGDSYKPDAINVYMDAIFQSPVPPELVSSRVQFVNDVGAVKRVKGGAFEWGTFRKYMTIAHPGAFHSRSLFEKHGLFDTTYSSAADYEFLMRCGPSLRALYLNVITAEMLVGGISNGYKGLVETYAIQRQYGMNYFSAKFRLWIACAKAYIRPFVRGY